MWKSETVTDKRGQSYWLEFEDSEDVSYPPTVWFVTSTGLGMSKRLVQKGN